MSRMLALAAALAVFVLAGCVHHYHQYPAAAAATDDGSVVTRTEVVRDVYVDPYPYAVPPALWWGWYGYPCWYYPYRYYSCPPRVSVGVHYGFSR